MEKEFIQKIREKLSDYGVVGENITYDENCLFHIEAHPLEFEKFVDKTNWSRQDIKIEAFSDNENIKLSCVDDSFLDEIIENDILNDELERINSEINNKLNHLKNEFLDKKASAHLDKPFMERIPSFLQDGLEMNEFLSMAKNWKAKVYLYNSASDDSIEYDDVGYIHIGIHTGTVVPVARSDEHNKGYDLLDYFKDKGWIPDDVYHPFYIHHNDYVDANDAIALQAMKIWRKIGDPNILIKNWTRKNGNFLITMDDYIKKEGDIEINKGELLPIGKEFLDKLKLISSLVIEVKSNPRKEKALFNKTSLLVNFIKNKFSNHTTKYNDILEKIDEAVFEKDIVKVENLIFGFDGLKNIIHNKIRKELDSKFSFVNDMESIFGDLELVNHELGSL